jgi:murein L,D-transpeptidase YcbB/YkuD
MTGDLDTFDANVTRVNGEIQAALKHYQKRMGLWESGTLNEITRKTLNVSVKRRLSQIKLNMERSRWERRPFGSDYVWINIPEYRMKLIRDGLADIDMRVVVGKVSNPTPIFTSKFSYVVVNPTWTVPSSIVKNEMLHRIQEDPDYLETHHFKLIKDKKRNREIDGFEIDWWQFDDESDFPFQFVRAAGSGNPLGKVKFMFPNPYAIYMHDTPDKYLFKNRKRAYSHGCIRLHKPQEFLDYVQANFMQNLDENQTEMINSPQTQEIPLDKNIPTFIRYYTAWVENDGTVNFRADVYGYDKIQSQFLK